MPLRKHPKHKCGPVLHTWLKGWTGWSISGHQGSLLVGFVGGTICQKDRVGLLDSFALLALDC